MTDKNYSRIESLEHLYKRVHNIPAEQKTKKPIEKSKRSAFLITINPNKNDFSFQSENEFIAYVNQLEISSKNFEANVSEFTGQYPGKTGPFQKPIVIETFRAIERGDKHARLHVQMLVKFSSVCWMNQPMIIEYFKQSLKDFNVKGLYVSTRSMKTDDLIKDYLSKYNKPNKEDKEEKKK